MTDDRSKTASLSPWWRHFVPMPTAGGTAPMTPDETPGPISRHRILTKVVTLGVGAMTLATWAFAQPASDHLACYLVKDSARKGKSTLTLTNAAVTQSRTIG